MRILIYSLNFSPELIGIGKYTGEMVEFLANKGHSVRVITAPPYYPEWQINGKYSSWRYCNEKISHALIKRCPIWVPRRPSGMKRILHLASFALTSFPKALAQISWRPHVVWVVAPAFFCVPAAAFTAKLSRAKAWLHIQDFEIDSAFKLGMLRSTVLQNFIGIVEGRLMKTFNIVSTISGQMMDRLDKKGIPGKKKRLFRNWVDSGSIYPMNSISIFRKKLAIPDDDIVALYSGNMGVKQELEIIVTAARHLLGQKKIFFVFCGRGAAYDKIRRMTADLPNVAWLPLQPEYLLNELLNLADIHLLPQRGDVEDLMMPSKLAGMMSSGRPVIATAHKGTQIDSALNQAGIVVPPGDRDRFISALIHLASDKRARVEMGTRGREYAIRHFERDDILSVFEKNLMDLKSDCEKDEKTCRKDRL